MSILVRHYSAAFGGSCTPGFTGCVIIEVVALFRYIPLLLPDSQTNRATFQIMYVGYWGEPERAPHKRVEREPRLYVCMYVSAYVVP